MTFEYKVIPAPTRGKKLKGLKTPADRFAKALSEAINTLAAEGWEYLRTDTLPAEERHGLTGRTTVFQNMLVFRRATEAGTDARPEVGLESHAAMLADTGAPRESESESKDRADAPDTGDDRRDVAAE